MKTPGLTTKSYATARQVEVRQKLVSLFEQCPIPADERLKNLELFMRRNEIEHLLFMNQLYSRILDVNGIIIEFGVRWGHNLALFESLRAMYEPGNYLRKIVGFDTFSGFPAVHEKDGASEDVRAGGYGVTPGYEQYLASVLDCHEQQNPAPEMKKYELVKGDAGTEIAKYVQAHPETIVALAYFDLDLYEPTIRCLEVLRDFVTKGTVIGFDELNMRDFPGETLALKEALGLKAYRIQRTPFSGRRSFIVIE